VCRIHFVLSYCSLFNYKVVDQYLSFISPSPSLFSLLPPPPAASDATSPTSSTNPETPSSYFILNSPTSTEQQIEEEIERIASGLFSAVATLGLFPIFDLLSFS